LREASQPPEDTLSPAVKAEPARVPSATKAMAESQGAIRHEEVPALVAERVVEEQRVEAAVEGTPVVEGMVVAGAVNQSFLYAPGHPEVRKRGEGICSERS